jgi:hypothetical protein
MNSAARIYLFTRETGEVLRRFDIPHDKKAALIDWLIENDFLEREEDEFVAIGAVATYKSRPDGTITHAFPMKVVQEVEVPRTP